MVHHVWSVVSRDSVINAETNSVSLLDVTEEITVTINKSQMPKDVRKQFEVDGKIIIPFNCILTSTIFRDSIEDAEEYESLIKVVNPMSVSVGEAKVQFVMEKYMKRMRNRVKFDGLPFEMEGSYVFQVFLYKKGDNSTGKAVATIPVDVKFKLI